MNQYGISEISVVPVRKEPNDQCEMISQFLFGETFQILEKLGKWSFIKSTFDNYEGWIDNKCISFLTEEIFVQVNSSTEFITQKLSNTILNNQNGQIVLPAGCTLPNFNSEKKTFSINDNQYSLLEDFINDSVNIESLAKQYLNSPYLWGGKNPYGIDCSGFAQVVYKVLGIKIPRDSADQVKEGIIINFISDTKLGDLAFFDNEEGEITHVGIIIGENEIIHASGKVRIDKLDQQGIYNLELNNYTHKLRVVKRLI
jgi:gamma-D-glutamyl-L-lysine dipeptidyl-peptidase